MRNQGRSLIVVFLNLPIDGFRPLVPIPGPFHRPTKLSCDKQEG